MGRLIEEFMTFKEISTYNNIFAMLSGTVLKPTLVVRFDKDFEAEEAAASK